MLKRILLLLLALAPGLAGQILPVIDVASSQPLGASAVRIADTLKLLGAALPSPADAELRRGVSAKRVQELLDPLCLVAVEINPESRVRLLQGPRKPELVEQGWRVFLVKVINQAGITPALQVDSPNAGQVPTRSEFAIPRRFLDVELYTKPPMKERLSGWPLNTASCKSIRATRGTAKQN